MKQRVIAKQTEKGNAVSWAVFVDGINRTVPGTGLTRAQANRIVKAIRERAE